MACKSYKSSSLFVLGLVLDDFLVQTVDDIDC